MSDIVIHVENLSKKYTIGRANNGRANGEGLRHALQHAATAPFRGLRKFRKLKPESQNTFSSQLSTVSSPSSEEFFALKDVSFDVRRGEVLGIIGRNGAGKSTLLKILSRITEPTSGRIGIKGRVASLLEVGTGFHPELTGRENIFLNGAILGMSRAEVKQKFDEIVAFAEVKKFLDTPVKHYSSGMYVRLAFAVAAHLEPEILIVDEVLAVGDIQFQEKCLGKMRDVANNDGRTVLFVSHNLNAIKGLCQRSALLANGILISEGKTSEVLQAYLQEHRKPYRSVLSKGSDIVITGLVLHSASGSEQSIFGYDEPIGVAISIEVVRPRKGVAIALELVHEHRGHVFMTSTIDSKIPVGSIFLKVGNYTLQLWIPKNLLRDGKYVMNAACTIPKEETIHGINEIAGFSLVDSESAAVRIGEGRHGAVMPQLDWVVAL